MASHNFQPFSRGKNWSDAETIARIASDTGTQYEEQVRARVEGYHAATTSWKRLAVNADGELVVNLEASAITIGLVDQGTGGASAWKVDGSAVTQPVSLAASVSVQQVTAASLNAQVVGNVGSASADSGNPVKVGAINKTTLLTLTDGQRSDLTVDTRQALQVTLMTRNSATAFMSASSPGRIDPTGSTTQPVSLAASVSAILTAETTKVIGTVNQPTGQGKTLLFGAIAQGAAGTTELVAAQGGSLKIKVVSYAFTLSLAGTAKFTGTGDLSGAFDIAASGGVAMAGQPSAHLFETAANAALSIVTTGGAAKGHFSYIVEA